MMIHGLGFLSLSASLVLPWALTGLVYGQRITESLVKDVRQSSSVPQMPLPNRKLISAVPTGTTYYVRATGSDRNSGLSTSSAFKTIQRAADLTNPGDTVLIMKGEYRNAPGRGAVLRIKRSGTANAWIKFKAYPGHFPTIRHNTWNGISISNGASYIEINGLEVIGNNRNINLTYAKQEYNKRNESNPLTNGNCISVDGRSNGRSHHINILNNKVHECGGVGISAIRGDYLKVDNNIVFNNGWYSLNGPSGISIVNNWSSDNNRGYKIFVTNNKSYNNRMYVPWIDSGYITDGNGIIIDVSKGYKGRVLVANNIVYNNGGSGIHTHDSERVDIVNNTAYLNQQTPELKKKGEIYAGYSSDVRIFNNIIWGSRGVAVNSNMKNVNVTYDYNMYPKNSVINMMGSHDMIADPKFVNASARDFRLKSTSPAINSGLRWSGVTTDILGNRRSGYAPARGAFEKPH